MKFRRMSPALGTEVIDFQLSSPSSANEMDVLRDFLYNSGLLVIRNQKIGPDELLDFTREFGKIESYTRSKFSLDEHPDILVLSNMKKEDGSQRGSPVSGRVWHIDGHYLENIPAVTILSMKTLQESGGGTSFANMQAAWSRLPEKVARGLSGRKITVSRVKSREYNYPERGAATPQEVAEWPDVEHPIVIEHPKTGRLGLAVGGNVPWDCPGTPRGEAVPLVTFLQEWVTRPEFVYEHFWKNDDLLVWDNRVVMHRASPYTGQRLLHRTTAFF